MKRLNTFVAAAAVALAPKLADAQMMPPLSVDQNVVDGRVRIAQRLDIVLSKRDLDKLRRTSLIRGVILDNGTAFSCRPGGSSAEGAARNASLNRLKREFAKTGSDIPITAGRTRSANDAETRQACGAAELGTKEAVAAVLDYMRKNGRTDPETGRRIPMDDKTIAERTKVEAESRAERDRWVEAQKAREQARAIMGEDFDFTTPAD